jgi:hypothetical protein
MVFFKQESEITKKNMVKKRLFEFFDGAEKAFEKGPKAMVGQQSETNIFFGLISNG